MTDDVSQTYKSNMSLENHIKHTTYRLNANEKGEQNSEYKTAQLEQLYLKDLGEGGGGLRVTLDV